MANNETMNEDEDTGLWGRMMGTPGGGLSSLTANPLFNLGMGLLQARYDRDVNPFQAATQGLLSAAQEQERQAKAARDEQARIDAQRLIESGQLLPQQVQAMQQMGMLPPDPNAPEMSMVGATPAMSYAPAGAQQSPIASQLAPSRAAQLAEGIEPSRQRPAFEESPDMTRFYEDEYWDIALGNNR